MPGDGAASAAAHAAIRVLVAEKLKYLVPMTIIFVIGGIVGAILMLVLFDWALIVVSSLIGAHLIQSAIVLPPSGSTILFLGLAVIGILVQAASLRRA